MTGCPKCFLDALRRLSFGKACREVANNVLVFFFVGLVRGVGARVVVAMPLDVLPFRLPDYRRLVRAGWLEVCCGGIGVDVLVV